MYILPRTASIVASTLGPERLEIRKWNQLLFIIANILIIGDNMHSNFITMHEKWNDGVLGLFCAHCLG